MYQGRSLQLLRLSAVLMLPLALGCRSGNGQGRGAGREPVNIQTTTSQRIAVSRQVELAGTLLSPDQAKVSSEVAGVIREVPVQLGTEVRPGDVLIRLDQKELSFALERAESALRQTEAQLGIEHGATSVPPDEQIAAVRQAEATREDATSNLQRVERLVNRGLLPTVELQNAQTRLKVADANYQASRDNTRALRASLQDRRAAYELAKKKLADADVRAPVGGAISERLVQPGEYIRENTPVATIVQTNPLKLRTAVGERYAALIRPGQPIEFRVESFPDASFKGEVAYVSPAVDQATRTFVVEALVDNKDRRLKPGFFAKGLIQTRLDENVLAVPEEAISTLAGVSAVYVVENGKIRQQAVSVGVKQGKLFEVADGLKGHEVLAASNLSQLATGTPVRVRGAGGQADGGAGQQRAPGQGQRGGRR